MFKRILHVTDLQRNFVKTDGSLPVMGAEALVEPFHNFLRQVKPGLFDFTLVTFDTHFISEYPFSEEIKSFPEIHCSYQKSGWQLAFDSSLLAKITRVFYMAKNVFDMWGHNPVGKEDTLAFDTMEEKSLTKICFM